MNAYIGRQPLYDRDYVLYGYDLLHRDNLTKTLRDVSEEDDELGSVFSDAVGMFDFDALTEGKPAHIRFTKNLLLSNFPYLVSPKRVVVEVSSDTSVNAAFSAKLNDLKVSGYRLALSGYDVRSGLIKFNKILQLFDIVYINAYQYSRLQIQDMIKHIRQYSPAKLLAEQVDTEADFDKVKDLRFSYFQGLLFGMPNVFRKEVNLGDTPYGKLYNELSRGSASFESCCKVLEAEPLLSYMFLQRIPAPSERADIGAEIRKDMMSVGTERLRKWSCLLMLKQLNVTGSQELPKKAYCRARFTETLIEAAGKRGDAPQGFVAAVFSLLPELTDTPLEGIVGQLRLDADIRAALTGKERNTYAAFLEFVREYEETKKLPNVPGVALNKGIGYLNELYAKCSAETESAFSVLNPFMPAARPASRR